MITSVSYRKSGSPQPEAYNTSGTFVRHRKSNSEEPSSSSTPSQSKSSPGNNKSRSFWQNLFRTKPAPDPASTLSRNTNAESGIDPLTRSRSSETVNSICSTNSFSFVSSRKYKGRKKGKRIPLPDESLPRPPHPQPNARRKISTLTRLGMKIGLKSKYNLQSCESLHRLHTIELANSSNANTIRKRRAPLPPTGVHVQIDRVCPAPASGCQVEAAIAAAEAPRSTPDLKEAPIPIPSSSKQAYGSGYAHIQGKASSAEAHRRCFSEGDYRGYVSPKSRYHVRGKRRAPPPPNPFGDPDAQETINENPDRLPAPVPEAAVIKLGAFRKNSNNETKNNTTAAAACSKIKAKNPRNSYVEKEIQSDNCNHPSAKSLSLLNHEKAVNDEVKAQLALLKIEADASALRLIKTKPTAMGSKKQNKPYGVDLAEGENQNQVVLVDVRVPHPAMEPPTPAKITPRPWYKRSSSKQNNSAATKKNTKPTMMQMTRFSDLDREASRIVEENRRHSAEISYKETAKELISMFNEFNINQQTVHHTSTTQSATNNFTSNNTSSLSEQANCILKPNSEISASFNSGSVSAASDTSIKPLVISATITTTASPGKLPTPDEPKKLAVVQPQSNPQKTSIGNTNSSAGSTTTTAVAVAVTCPRITENRVAPSNSTPLPPPLCVPENQKSWCCPRCTLENDYWRSFCDACHFKFTSGSTVQTITSLFENVNRQVESRLEENAAPPVQTVKKLLQKPVTSKVSKPLDRDTNCQQKVMSFPPCENFLSQLPLKEKLANEEKLLGMKLKTDPEVEELDIGKLREARVAFFERNRMVNEESKPNNLAKTLKKYSADPKSSNKENVFSDSEDEALDTLLEIHQQLNPNISGTGPQTWKPLNVQKFRPMLESIVESSNDHSGLSTSNPIYENLNLNVDDDRNYIQNQSEASTNMFMQNIQTQLKDHIRYFENLSSGENTPEENDEENMSGNRRQLTLEEYQKLGAIPKYFQNRNEGEASSSRRRQSQPEGVHNIRDPHSENDSYQTNTLRRNSDKSNEKSAFAENTFAISKLLRNLEWAIAKGDHRLAASLAHDLAIFKVNCIVSKATQDIVIRVYVEDRFMQQGPFQVQVTSSTRVKELKAKIECDWGIPMSFQKWILGRRIAEDDNHTLSYYEIVNDSMAFLYLVTPGSENEKLPSQNSNSGICTPNRAKLASPVRRDSIEENIQQQLPSQPIIGSDTEAMNALASCPKNLEKLIQPKPKVTNQMPKGNTPTAKEQKISEQVISPKLNASSLHLQNLSIEAPPVLPPKSKPKAKRMDNLNEKNSSPIEAAISKIQKLKAEDPPIERISGQLSETTRNAQIKYNLTLAEATNDIKKSILPELQQIKPSSPELTTVNIHSEIIKKLPSFKTLMSNPNDPHQNPNPQLSSRWADDNSNNNVTSNELPPQTQDTGSNSNKSKSNKKTDKKKHKISEIFSIKLEVKPNNLGVLSKDSIEKTPRGRKLFKVKNRKVNQSTSIERNAPIRGGNVKIPVDSPASSTGATIPKELRPPMIPKERQTTSESISNAGTETSFFKEVVTPGLNSQFQSPPRPVSIQIPPITPSKCVSPPPEKPAVKVTSSQNNSPFVTSKMEIFTAAALGSIQNSISPVVLKQNIASVSEGPGKYSWISSTQREIPPTQVVNVSLNLKLNQKEEESAATFANSPENTLSSPIQKISLAPEKTSPQNVLHPSRKVEVVVQSPIAVIGFYNFTPLTNQKDNATSTAATVTANFTPSIPSSNKTPDAPIENTRYGQSPKSPQEDYTPGLKVRNSFTPLVQVSYQKYKSEGLNTMANNNQPASISAPVKMLSESAKTIATSNNQPVSVPNVSNLPTIEPIPTPDTPSMKRRNSLPVNKQAGKTIGGIFMSKVSNLIAVVEDRSKNLERTSSIKNSDVPRRKSLNENVLRPPGVPPWVNPEVVGNSASGKTKTDVNKEIDGKEDNFQTYKRMLQLMEKEDFIKTSEEVDCPICLSEIPAGEGITLRDCLHSFCRDCLIGSVQYSEEPQVRCPFRDNIYSCDSYMQEREVKGLVPADLYDRHLIRSVKLAESKMSNTFHCKTNDCTGWCIFEDDVNLFNCPVCKKRNCLTCQAIHDGQNCQEYQRELAIAAETDEDAKSSRLMLEKMISRGEALDCPACHVVLLKKWGCDWVRCSYCKTEICWVTKGFRWGPNGKGDTSGGCKCGINGVRCHPKCTYCH